jgi:formiminotetrahydrofolate cyclodeaminase
VAALVVGLAADLVAQVARASPDWDERGGALAQANAICERALTLAPEIERTHEAAVEALSHAVAPAPAEAPAVRDLGQALRRSVDSLLALGEAASDAAQLAELAARTGATDVRADAVAAAVYAAAAAEVCAHLVEINLLSGADDASSQRAQELLSASVRSREAARALPR